MLNKVALESELKRFWKKDNMVKHCLKHSKYIELDGWFVNCCDSKPAIAKTIWYDDETDGPDNNKATFLRANERNIREPLTDDRKYYLIKNYWRQTDEKLASISSYRVWEEPTPKESENVIRQLTLEELAIINKAIEEVNVNFRKRLETYWKRYSDKVSVRGYWVNR